MAEWTGIHRPDESLARNSRRSLFSDAVAATLAVGVVLLGGMHFFGGRLALDTPAIGAAIAIYAAISVVSLGTLGGHGHSRFGFANIITTIRGAVTAVLGGLLLASSDFGHPESLWITGSVVAVALGLDGIDGYFARRGRTASPFGARFDMEIDALLIFFLSLAAFQLNKAGAWVLLIGLMRYGYVAAQTVFSGLRGELPPSIRRKAICVVQGITLWLLLFPVVAPPVSNLLAAGALAALSYSFAVDMAFLLNRNGRGHAG
jgi:phosphatidylglycerophosphate synthase